MIDEVDGPRNQLTIRVLIPDRTVEQVYRDWTETSRLTTWWPIEAAIDPRTGGAYHFSWPAHGWHLRGRFLEVVVNERLRFTWTWDHEPEVTKEVSVRLVAKESRVQVEVIHGPYDGSPHDLELRDSHRAGWVHFLGRLAEPRDA